MDVMTDVAAEIEDDEDEDRGTRGFTKELWFLLIVALGLALLMKTFLIQAFFIPSGSMERTLHGCPGCTGDRVLVNKLVYKFRDIHRGEIVVFNGKNTDFQSDVIVTPPKNLVEKIKREALEAVGFGGATDKDFIKRVIGVEGDTVACCTNDHVTVNGQELIEPYVHLTQPGRPHTAFGPVEVPEGRLWVMGDHRDGSSDSRSHGTIPTSSVVGRAFAVFYPVYPKNRTKILRVPETFDPPNAAAAPHVLGLALAVPVTVVRRRLRLTRD